MLEVKNAIVTQNSGSNSKYLVSLLRICFLSSLVIILFFTNIGDSSSRVIPISGTAVVFIWTPREAILASDSKQTDPEHLGNSENVCKILITPRFAFVSTGLSELLADGFNVKAIANEVGNNTSTPSSVVNSFEKLLVPKLERALEFARSHVLEIYNRQYKNKVVINGLFMFATDPPKIIVTSYRSKDTGGKIQLEHRIYECPRVNKISKFEWNAYGHVEGLSGYLLSMPDFFKNRDVSVMARDLVQAAIDTMPDYVGPPISIVSVSKKKISRVDSSKMCQ